MSAASHQERGDYTCGGCDEPLVYDGEQERTARQKWRSRYRCPNPDCETDEVLLR
jgi:hypothetical protein